MGFLVFLGGVALAFLRTLADGWALWMLWGWFVVPLGVVPIGFWHACGLDLLIGMTFAFAAPRREDPDHAADLTYAAAKLTIAPLVVAAAWLIHGAM